MSIVVINGSGREGGNTETLTRLALEGLEFKEIVLREKQILPIVDQRHTPGGFDPVNDDYDAVIQDMLAADVLIFVSPIYWYNVTGLVKNLFDRWSQSLRDPRFTDFKEKMAKKKAYAIVVGGDNPRIKALPMIQQLKYTFDFVGLPFEGYVLGQASKPGDIQNDRRALAEAAWLNDQLKALVNV
ncbi:flavodoxin family protein [Paenibacillus physcomitrellae]|uniref:NAD(P)H-dependent FMN-containing oxidoreductase YwqN n=1 Tax=Paenibacillus physcomitrellae TaxID=1619311 RepID=A0ABQ1FUF9_9BACL|nr:flavodoxin family protein [Paenibacillus physcomitrellae]GGA31102.1 putative NAD(P)H-dependent FMN-containing oxidoreductase YwqN [Paenibacillus physcomitrellae]